jgi:hypothetical protein
MSEMSWLWIMEQTQEAIYAFAKVECRSLVRRAIYRLQRVEASGIYGDDYKFKSLWDEYCHEVQNGPYMLLDGAWDEAITATLNELVGSLVREIAVLLTIHATGPLPEDEGADIVGTVWNEGIANMLRDQLAEEAGARSLDHLDATS